jgi:hypothetical protein
MALTSCRTCSLATSGARIKSDANSEFMTRWKTGEGFVLIDAATVIAISDAVLEHFFDQVASYPAAAR